MAQSIFTLRPSPPLPHIVALFDVNDGSLYMSDMKFSDWMLITHFRFCHLQLVCFVFVEKEKYLVHFFFGSEIHYASIFRGIFGCSLLMKQKHSIKLKTKEKAICSTNFSQLKFSDYFFVFNGNFDVCATFFFLLHPLEWMLSVSHANLKRDVWVAILK